MSGQSVTVLFVWSLLLLRCAVAQDFRLNGDLDGARRYLDSVEEYLHTVADVYASLVDRLTTMIKRGENSEDKMLEFSDMAAIDYNVSDICMNHTLTTIDDLAAGEMYALKMFDAWAKLPPGVLSINLKWTGAYEQCINITRVGTKRREFGAHYCMAAVSGVGLIPKNISGGQELPLQFGICVPDTCSDNDVKGFMNAVLSLIPAKTPLQVNDAGCSTDTVPYTGGDIVAMFFCAIFLLLAILGTGYDYYDQWRQHSLTIYVNRSNGVNIADDLRSPEPETTDEDEKLITYATNRDQTYVHKLLLSFSIVKNGSKIFDISNVQKDIQILHGIRVNKGRDGHVAIRCLWTEEQGDPGRRVNKIAISMSWVILGHVHLFYVMDYDNIAYLLFDVMRRWTFQAIGNATFSVDTFFFLSGLLVTYLTLKYLSNNDGQLRWVMFYVHRYLRLTPVYAFCLLFYTTLMFHLPQVPQTGQSILGMGRTDNPCKRYWWANLLYINNFVPLHGDQQCFGWAWYLANDMQFYVISPFILILLYKKPRAGLFVIALLTLLCLGVTGFISTYFGVFTQQFGTAQPLPRNQYNVTGFDYIYMKPYTRISTYLVGMVTGYLLYQTGCKKMAFKLEPGFVVLCWALAFANALAVLYGLADDIKQQRVLSYDLLSFYTSVSRFAWSLSLAWLTIACVHGYGGPITQILEWKFWVPMSRLTYCAYLVHPIWIMFHAGLLSTPIRYNDINMVYVYIGGLVCSYSVALIVSLLIEAPLLAVEKIFLPK